MSPTTEKRLVTLLTLQAIACGVAVIVLVSQNWPASFGATSAVAQPVPVAGGGGVFMMPGQLAQNAHGVFVLDTDLQNILVYQYDPSDKMLLLRAARNFSFDRQLRNHNTSPSPASVREMIDQERAAEAQENSPRPKAP